MATRLRASRVAMSIAPTRDSAGAKITQMGEATGWPKFLAMM
jgi:hypothetical protein